MPTPFLPVPIVRQSTTWSCGSATLLSLLMYWGVYEGTEQDLWEDLGTNEATGTAPDRITDLAHEMGLEASCKAGMGLQDLRECLESGATVILGVQAWPDSPVGDWKGTWDDGHYVVLVGMDEDRIYMMDPSVGTGYAWIPVQEFLDRWHEDIAGTRTQSWGIVVKGETPMQSFPGKMVQIT